MVHMTTALAAAVLAAAPCIAQYVDWDRYARRAYDDAASEALYGRDFDDDLYAVRQFDDNMMVGRDLDYGYYDDVTAREYGDGLEHLSTRERVGHLIDALEARHISDDELDWGDDSLSDDGAPGLDKAGTMQKSGIEEPLDETRKPVNTMENSLGTKRKSEEKREANGRHGTGNEDKQRERENEIDREREKNKKIKATAMKSQENDKRKNSDEEKDRNCKKRNRRHRKD